jgi:hypothetical protein
MHVLATIFGLLLLLFGGGCTLIFLFGVISDARSMLTDVPLLLTLWVPLGLLPLGVGYWLFRLGLRISRRKREAAGGPRPPGPPSSNWSN